MIKKMMTSLMMVPVLATGIASTLPKSAVASSTYRVFGKQYTVRSSSRGYEAKGLASWYGPGFNKRKTASGATYNMYAMTAAHKTLPLNSKVVVTNLKNNRKVIVTVNDRGPFVGTRLIDLSYGAAKQLGMVGQGVAPVSIKAI